MAPPLPTPSRGEGSVPSLEDACGQPALLDLVGRHTPRGPREALSYDRFLNELARLERPCDRDADPVHVTASGIVIGDRGTVLHLHRRLQRWLQPGGHIEAGEHPAQAAQRESEEETGLALQPVRDEPLLLHLDVHPAAQGHTHLDLRFLFWSGPEDPSPPQGESPWVRWFAWDGAFAVADDALIGALRVAHEYQSTGSLDQERRAREWQIMGSGSLDEA